MLRVTLGGHAQGDIGGGMLRVTLGGMLRVTLGGGLEGLIELWDVAHGLPWGNLQVHVAERLKQFVERRSEVPGWGRLLI